MSFYEYSRYTFYYEIENVEFISQMYFYPETMKMLIEILQKKTQEAK